MPEVPAQRLNWQWAEPENGGKPVASLDLHFEFERYGNKWVGTCVELSTSTYARSRRKTSEALHQLVLEHLNLLEESGERNRFFDEWGLKLIIPPVDHEPSEAEEREPSPPPRAMERLHQLALGFESRLAGIGS